MIPQLGYICPWMVLQYLLSKKGLRNFGEWLHCLLLRTITATRPI